MLLIEAGSRELAATSEIPAFHALVHRRPVDRLGDTSSDTTKRLSTSRRDSKWCEKRQGILYPRASGIGGCTVHNAMITMSGPADDWNAIASMVDDQSWNSERMRRLFRAARELPLHPSRLHRPRASSAWSTTCLRNCGAANREARLRGWLDTSWGDPRLIAQDRQLVRNLLAAFWAARQGEMTSVFSVVARCPHRHARRELDPNHWEQMRRTARGAGARANGGAGRTSAKRSRLRARNRTRVSRVSDDLDRYARDLGAVS